MFYISQNIYFSMIYNNLLIYYCHMNIDIFFGLYIANHNYEDFQHLNFIFSQNFRFKI